MARKLSNTMEKRIYSYKLFTGSRLVSSRRSSNARRFGQILASLSSQISHLDNPHVYLRVDYGTFESNFGKTRFTNEGSYNNWHDLKKAWEAFRTAV